MSGRQQGLSRFAVVIEDVFGTALDVGGPEPLGIRGTEARQPRLYADVAGLPGIGGVDLGHPVGPSFGNLERLNSVS